MAQPFGERPASNGELAAMVYGTPRTESGAAEVAKAALLAVHDSIRGTETDFIDDQLAALYEVRPDLRQT